uniref:protein-glutamine gamma-glutamyltransferase n=1 Tax=Varanus komodoensis TaxID=61221 RepID=A0A8D2KXQ9_VARKO
MAGGKPRSGRAAPACGEDEASGQHTPGGCGERGWRSSPGVPVLLPPELQLMFIDWQCPSNNRQHRTAEMSNTRLITRRGQPFTFTLHFLSRGYQPGLDSIYLVAETGPQPDRQLGTRSIFLVGQGLQDRRPVWGADAAPSGPRSTDITVWAPAEVPVGRYQLKTRIDSGQASASYHLGEFIVLFNTWCPDDDVYLHSEAERHEYVLSDHGLIYQGNSKWIQPVPWNYGQEDMVGIALRVLDRSLDFQQDPAQDCASRGSPVYVSRVVSAMINSLDDKGVLQGNWSEDYSDGVRPSDWNGSTAILRQWDRTGGQAVKYGQCWVFAAVMCTVLRCLGIPTRVVTNFDSGHDTDGNLVIDVLLDKTSQVLPMERKDSIWNFHVWNESWMARRDLPMGYGGWQVLDATPQERSQGLFRCGPAPVRAVRDGELHLPYDTPFVFSMVNADRVVWLLHGAAKEMLLWETNAVGNHISTKQAGTGEREDLTHAYKHKEGSSEERHVFEKALAQMPGRGATRSRTGLRAGGAETWRRHFPHRGGSGPPEPPTGAQTSLELKLAESPEIGQDIQLVLVARNLELAAKQLQLSLSAQGLLHTSRPLPPFWQDKLYLSLSPAEGKRLRWRIPFEQYGAHLGDDRQVHVVAVGEENTSWLKALAEKTITIASPALAIHVLAPVVVNQPFPLRVDFANPLPVPVGHCVLTLEGCGLVLGQASLPTRGGRDIA